jgi:hypothetical protein
MEGMRFWWKRCIILRCVADRRLPRPNFFASRGVGVPDSRPSPRGRHGVADVSTGLEKALALFGTRGCGPIFADDPQNEPLWNMPVEMLLKLLKQCKRRSDVNIEPGLPNKTQRICEHTVVIVKQS